MNQETLEQFFKVQLPLHLDRLTPQLQPLWGRMNVQQTIEHLSLTFLMATGQFKVKLTTPEEKLPLMKRVLLSDKAFPKEFQNPLLPKDPIPVSTAHLNEAKEGLKQSVEKFFLYFKENPEATTLNNVWGPLNYYEWMVMNYKHIKHHMAQFGVEIHL